MSNADQHVIVIGGGVIGVACAHYLNRDGFRVTVIDKGKIGAECSHGNCGLVSPSHVLPLAEPGAIGMGVAAILKTNGALRIKPRWNVSLWRWMYQFARRCNPEDRLRSGRAIQPLLRSSMKLYEELINSENVQCEWQKRGLLFVYKHKSALDAYEPVNHLMEREFDEPARRLDGPELTDFEPALRSGLAGAWYFEHDAHLRPDRLLSSWRALLERRGVEFQEQRFLEAFDVGTGVVQCASVSGQQLQADTFVVATGARTPQLASVLRRRLPIEPGKGYSITLPRRDTCPKHPMIFPEHRVAVTPMETGMRLGSMMEFCGYNEEIRVERLRLLTTAAVQYLRDFTVDERWPEKWFGWRPMTYDSTPIIGRCPGFKNVYLATGHNMLGLSMAPATGLLISDLVTNRTPHLSPTPYAVHRF